MAESNRGIQIMLFSCMVIGALLVILTCIWKLVKLVARYKMESRIEDLEALSAAQNANGAAGASGAPVDISSLMSPKGARHLRKLSILAGFEKKWSRSQRSSISGGANSNHSITTGRPFRLSTGGGGATSPIRRVAELLGRRRSSNVHHHHHSDHPKYATTSNGRVASNFLAPPPPMYQHQPPQPQHSQMSRGFIIKDCLSPNEADGASISEEESPVLKISNCAIHGNLPPRCSSALKVSTASQTAPCPPPGFDEEEEDEEEEEDCISAPNSLCFDSPLSSEIHPTPVRSSAVASDQLHHHIHTHDHLQHTHHGEKQHRMRCINPNHFHHHHHHHDPPTIKLTHNPIASSSHSHSGSDETSNNTMAALLFHPPQYQCVICQHNASLYRALSNPSLFSRKPPTHSSSTSAGAAANTSCVSTTMTPTHTPAASGQTGSGQLRNKHSTSVNSSAAKNDKKYEGSTINSSTNNHDTDPDEEVIKECECRREDEDDDDEDNEDEEDLEDVPMSPPPKLELKRHHSKTTFGSAIKNSCESIYSDPKVVHRGNSAGPAPPSSSASVHWNSSMIERKGINDD